MLSICSEEDLPSSFLKPPVASVCAEDGSAQCVPAVYMQTPSILVTPVTCRVGEKPV